MYKNEFLRIVQTVLGLAFGGVFILSALSKAVNIFSIKANPHMPVLPMMHAFLTDKDGNVILAGNPFSNQRMLEMVLEYLNQQE